MSWTAPRHAIRNVAAMYTVANDSMQWCTASGAALAGHARLGQGLLHVEDAPGPALPIPLVNAQQPPCRGEEFLEQLGVRAPDRHARLLAQRFCGAEQFRRAHGVTALAEYAGQQLDDLDGQLDVTQPDHVGR